jgi:hypothetical protein
MISGKGILIHFVSIRTTVGMALTLYYESHCLA